MAERANRNILAALLVVAGAILVAVSPVSADGESPSCVDVTFDFDSLGQGPLTKNQPTLGPVTVAIGAGTYNVIMTSSDPTHEAGKFVNQLNESWFLVTNGGYTGPITPDIPEADTSLQIVDSNVRLNAATQITAVWAGAAPSFDSVHAAVTLQCTDDVVPLGSTIPSTSSTTAVPVTTAPTTSAPITSAPATTAPGSDTTAVSPTTVTPTTAATSPSTEVAPATSGPTSTTAVVDSGTSETTSVVTAAAQTDDGGDDDNPELGQDGDELAATGVNLNLAIGGISLIVAGLALVISGQMADQRRRRLAYVRA